MPTTVDIVASRGNYQCQQALAFDTKSEGKADERHPRHSDSRYRRRSDRFGAGGLARCPRSRDHRRRPAGRRSQHVPRRGGERTHARGSRTSRRGQAAREGRRSSAEVHDPRPRPHADPDRLQRVADGLPVLADGAPVDHRAATARTPRRTRRCRAAAEDP
jgi:hypothetical protein